MKELIYYFFSQGETQEFFLFSPAHFAPILLLIATILLIRKYADRLRGWKHEQAIRYALAFALIISEMSYYWRLVGVPALGANPIDHLPIAVCGWAAIFCSYMVIGKTQLLFDISYFWLLSGSLFALLTPTPLTFCGPTRFRYYQFWTEHTLGYVAVFYMIFVHGMRPNRRSMVRSYVALLVMTAIAYFTNRLIPGANYLYMARPESAPSVLDILPPNFLLRFAVMFAVITAMYGLAYLPWHLKDKKANA
jgi:hypothetical integral membrane protein (TIGR02206 family)